MCQISNYLHVLWYLRIVVELRYKIFPVVEVGGATVFVEEERLAQLGALLVVHQPLQREVVVDVLPVEALVVDVVLPGLVVAVRRGEVVVHVEGPVSQQTPGLVLNDLG